MECPEKIRSYMEALEEERRKIQVFQRELPLCLDLVTQAIEACKQRLSGTTSSMEGTNGQMSECSEQNLMDGHPALEEFIPIKRTSSSDNHHERDEEEEEDDDDDNGGGDEQHSGNYGDSDEKKSNWLKSAQLWNPNPEAITHDDEDSPPLPFRGSGLDGKANCGVFRRFPTVEKVAGKSSLSSGKDAAPLPSTAAASTSSTAEKGGGATGNREEKQRPSTRRKARRCWSVDLHRRFVHAVQQLGGPHVATPKQIKELMKVEDLTSDEVKSHLQKYRLYSKNCPRHSSGNAQPPQFVVVGGIWVPPPPPHYAAAAAATIPGAAHGTYAPVVAAVPPEDAQRRVVWTAQEKPLGSGSQGFEAHGSSNSTTTSTSTHTVIVC